MSPRTKLLLRTTLIFSATSSGAMYKPFAGSRHTQTIFVCSTVSRSTYNICSPHFSVAELESLSVPPSSQQMGRAACPCSLHPQSLCFQSPQTPSECIQVPQEPQAKGNQKAYLFNEMSYLPTYFGLCSPGSEHKFCLFQTRVSGYGAGITGTPRLNTVCLIAVLFLNPQYLSFLVVSEIPILLSHFPSNAVDESKQCTRKSGLMGAPKPFSLYATQLCFS